MYRDNHNLEGKQRIVMMRITFFLLVYFAVVHCRSRTVTDHVDELIKKSVENYAKKSAEETSGLFEGDIDIDEDTKRYLLGADIMSRDAVISPIYYWPNGLVYYTFDSALASQTVKLIKSGIHHLKERTCLKFVEVPENDDTHQSRIKFFSGDGCYSRIGRDPRNIEQKISIGIGCERIGTVVHEIMHSLGFFHEHTRPDRDKYISIDWANILKVHAHNFQKYPRGLGSSFGKPYDYDSVMHYSMYAFSKDRRTPTIVPRDKQAVIGQRLGLSYYDREEINSLYNCKEDCVDKLSPYRCLSKKAFGHCLISLHRQKMINDCPKTCSFCAIRKMAAQETSSTKTNMTKS